MIIKTVVKIFLWCCCNNFIYNNGRLGYKNSKKNYY